MTTFPGFTLPDELRLIREQVRRFIREEIIPLEHRLDPDAPGIPDEDFKRLSEKTRAAGLWALAAPEDYGGGGVEPVRMSGVPEEMAEHRLGRCNVCRGRGGISCFIIEPGTPGFAWKNIRTIRTAAIPNDVVFEDCVLPADALIGQEGQGLDLAFDLLVKNRFPYSATNLGVAVAAHRMAIEHAKQRETFGQKLSQRQAIQWMLADAEVELRACRWLIWEGAWKADRGEDARVEASIAKLYSSEVLGRVVDAAVQIHGGYGVSKEFPLERWYREGRVRRIGEGPSEVHRMVIARSLFR